MIGTGFQKSLEGISGTLGVILLQPPPGLPPPGPEGHKGMGVFIARVSNRPLAFSRSLPFQTAKPSRNRDWGARGWKEILPKVEEAFGRLIRVSALQIGRPYLQEGLISSL